MSNFKVSGKDITAVNGNIVIPRDMALSDIHHAIGDKPSLSAALVHAFVNNQHAEILKLEAQNAALQTRNWALHLEVMELRGKVPG